MGKSWYRVWCAWGACVVGVRGDYMVDDGVLGCCVTCCMLWCDGVECRDGIGDISRVEEMIEMTRGGGRASAHLYRVCLIRIRERALVHRRELLPADVVRAEGAP
jgi:hypothetical protein